VPSAVFRNKTRNANRADLKKPSPIEKIERCRIRNIHGLGHKWVDASKLEIFQEFMCPKTGTPGSRK